jgi:hypothetical protein
MPDTVTESPPAPIQYSLDPVKLFAGFERDSFRLRDPVTDTSGLYRTMAAGDCLEPLCTAGDMLYIELGAIPQSGDIVMFEWSEAVQKSWAVEPTPSRVDSEIRTRGLLAGMQALLEIDAAGLATARILFTDE